jgi:hypothetical protein
VLLPTVTSPLASAEKKRNFLCAFFSFYKFENEINFSLSPSNLLLDLDC